LTIVDLPQRFENRIDIPSVAGFCYNFHILQAVKHRAKTCPDKLVIVGQQHSNGLQIDPFGRGSDQSESRVVIVSEFRGVNFTGCCEELSFRLSRSLG